MTVKEYRENNRRVSRSAIKRHDRRRGFATIIGSLVAAAISTAASYVYSRLTAKKHQTPFDNKPTTLAVRGSTIPKVIGHCRVGYIFAWSGNRTLVDASGGSKGLGGSGSQVNQYYEAGWHQLCIGPVDAIYGIYQNGKQIYSNVLTRTNTVSGTTFQCPNQVGTFSVFWGECNQPVNTYLGSTQENGTGQQIYPGVLSRWPRLCYILWHDKNLGTTPYWPQIEYEIESRLNPTTTTLVQSSPWLDATTGTDGARNSDDGVNPAHALWMLMTAPFPDGAGVDPTVYNLSLADFEALGVLCQNEHIPMNMVLTDGQDFNSAIADIMADVGFYIAQRGDTLLPVSIRPINDPTTIPTLDDTVNTTPDPEIERLQGNIIADRIQFTLKDRAINFHEFTINFGNDAVANQNNRPRMTKVELPTITDRFTAYRVAERRRLEFLDRMTIKVGSSREARLLIPGQAFNYNPYGVVRVNSVKVSTTSFGVELDCVLDQYTLAATGLAYGDQGGLIIDTAGAQPDVLVVPFILPPALRPNKNLIYFGIARVRANPAISGAAIWASVDGGTSYTQVGEQDKAAAGGTLNAPISATTVGTAVSPLAGPTITSYNTDITAITDLSSNPNAWKSGNLLCIIDQEVFYLQSVSPVTGGYQLNNLIRAQYSTVAADHAANAPVAIFGRSNISPITDGSFSDGLMLYIKSVPFTSDNVVDITTVIPVELTINQNATASITLLAPVDSSTVWPAGSKQTIQWRTTGDIYNGVNGNTPFSGTIDLSYSLDGGVTFQAIDTNQPNNGSFVWTIPSGIASTDVIVRVASHVTPSLYDQSPYPFTITGAAVITLTSPSTGSESWLVGTVQSITWTEVPVVGLIDLYYATASTNFVPIVVGAPNNGSYPWYIPSDAVGTGVVIRISQNNEQAIQATSPAFDIHN